jgi:hypothetical protein
VARLDELFAIDAEARRQAVSLEADSLAVLISRMPNDTFLSVPRPFNIERN